MVPILFIPVNIPRHFDGIRPDFFLLIDLWDFVFRFRVGGRIKSSENDQLIGHFQNFFNISRTNSKTSKVNQHSVLSLSIFHNFHKNLHRAITFNSVTLKYTQT